MRKFLAVFLVLFSAIALIGCTEDEKGLYVKGEYTHKINGTSVDLIVDKNGFITSVNIDVDYEGTTKKTLGYGYRMHGPGMNDDDYKAYLEAEGLLEWFEQAELLEQAVIDNQGIFGIKEDKKVDGVAGVTISVNTYHEVLKEVLKSALK